MLFGSDFPFTGERSIEETMTAIGELNIPKREKRMILGENALRLLRLDHVS
jgi:predicted TIM-barrel fold metal-dependent hydrolase